MILSALVSGKPKLAYREWRAWQRLQSGDGLKLHLGCGQRRLPGFINIDHNLSGATDYVGNIVNLPCRPNSVERIETYHVIEHIPMPIVRSTLSHWHSILKPGGTLVLECPDLRRDCEEYLAGNADRLRSIFGPQRFPGDAHHWGYTVESLSELVLDIGFASATCETPQDYHTDIEPCIRVVATK